MRRTAQGLLVLALLAVMAACGEVSGQLGQAASGQAASGQAFYDHIFVIVEENLGPNALLNNPKASAFNRMADSYGLATLYYGVTHPSEGNYVAMIGADDYGIRDDNPYREHQINSPSLVDQLEAAGLTWKGYFQSMPAPGYEGTCYPVSSCLYASKHNPFLDFTHIANSAVERANLVPDTELMPDLAAGNVANFNYIVPDLCHDMHGVRGICPNQQTNIRVADQYLASVVALITATSTWREGHNAIVVTFDEGNSDNGCCDANPGGGRVVTVVETNGGATGLRDPTPYNHYSLAATIEKAFGLGCIQNACDTTNVKPMDALFGMHSTPDS